MAILKSSIPYARALFDLGKEKGLLSNFKVDLTSIYSIIHSSEEFRDIISNPTINPAQKTEVLSKLFNGKVSTEVSGFLSLLTKKGRIGELSSIAEAFTELVDQEENTVQVRLTTATQISDDAKKQIASKVLGSSKYEIQNVINPDIIGGYILEFNNKMLDNSISTKIQTLKNNLDK